jgi:ParB-like chromosome segregation protein Spo0J
MSTVRDLAVSRKEVLCFSPDQYVIDSTFNVREDFGDLDELAKSIAENGYNPAFPMRGYVKEGKIVLVDGHRRLKAINEYLTKYSSTPLKSIPCVVEEKGVNEEERVLTMFQAGTGKELTTLEQAACIRKLQGYGWSIPDIAKKIAKTQIKVHQLLDLNGASKALRDAIRNQIVSTTAALKIAKAPLPKQEALMERLATLMNPTPTSTKKKVKVREVEKAVKGTPANVSGKKIVDAIKETETLIKKGDNISHWKAVRYGLRIALGEETVEVSHKF